MRENRQYIFNAELPGEILDVGEDLDKRIRSILYSYKDFREDSILGILGLEKYNLISEIVMYSGLLQVVFLPSDGNLEDVPKWAVDVLGRRSKAEEKYKATFGNSWIEDFKAAKEAYAQNFPLTSSSLMTMIYSDLKNLETEESETEVPETADEKQ